MSAAPSGIILRRIQPMKRSAINEILGHTRQFFSQH
ncbi:TPA: D-lyxose/D-mannose family sugar isomerase, partial [Citrobacter freundii]|nr:D-lyxose/D-mannose family sugar isomerase [Citrobacter freundii]